MNEIAATKSSLLILDVDETLLFATERRLAHAPDFRFGPYHVYLRPYLQEFLQHCYRRYRIALWSTADAGYLAVVRTYALPADLHLEFVWSRDRCVRCYDPEWRETYYVKDLRKVRRHGFDLAKTLIVDDTPQKVERSYGNAIYVPEFRGEPEDDLLRRLANYLEALADTADVRGLEKRNWKAHY
ncbi:HAD family hydrolase [Blastopirellula sp. JC732]|uniref:HAD family hydrolase n=1 Tax=Blastopirellula sediminis TaxID=2894196 RepID=A0A9X1MJF5_9BACT|nr:HAD family hydrolase [Blastopirellula sediminis]MCC9607767.1 HAD family hydrolase [Blastopirellula sediminis]MCC9627440.1 HAD family hydrolase [Blastopirellula sediminis]